MGRPRVLIVGGSLIGLLAANLLFRCGWDVTVLERTAGGLEGRGAGITILPGLIEAFRAAGVDETEAALGIELPARIALDRTGRIIAERRFAQVMTSWSRLYQALERLLPDHFYRRGITVRQVESESHSVSATLSNGDLIRGDLLIAADGLRSTVRAQLLPRLQPHYCGYVAWRCLCDERELPADMVGELFDRYAVCIAPGEQAIGYPVPGPQHEIAVGHRQYNVVWYHSVDEHIELPRFLTDDQGRYFKDGIAPAALSTHVRDQMIEIATRGLAPQFAGALSRARVHFFQPIIDIEPPRLAFGRIALVGDAAFVVRPHVAMGVPKGAGDVMALHAALMRSGGDVEDALREFEARRLAVGRKIAARGRRLGAYMQAQRGSASERERAERERVPEQVMMDTAAPIDYESGQHENGVT